MVICWLAYLEAALCSCVEDGLCAAYGFYHYKALDNTPRDSRSKGCQLDYLRMPAGWEIAGWDTESRHVASSYNWGTAAIVHGKINEYTMTSLVGGSCGQCKILTGSDAGTATYKPSSCHIRILIRQRREVANCSKKEGLPYVSAGGQIQCSLCPSGHLSYGGTDADCLPTLAYMTLQIVDSPPFAFTVEPCNLYLEEGKRPLAPPTPSVLLRKLPVLLRARFRPY